MIEGADWLSTGVLLAGVVATFVRVEQRGASNRDELQDMRADVQAQHTGLESALTKTRDELRTDVQILFKTSNDHDKRIERLLTISEQHEQRISRTESHTDQIGREIGIGKVASGVGR